MKGVPVYFVQSPCGNYGTMLCVLYLVEEQDYNVYTDDHTVTPCPVQSV